MHKHYKSLLLFAVVSSYIIHDGFENVGRSNRYEDDTSAIIGTPPKKRMPVPPKEKQLLLPKPEEECCCLRVFFSSVKKEEAPRERSDTQVITVSLQKKDPVPALHSSSLTRTHPSPYAWVPRIESGGDYNERRGYY